MTHYHYIGLRAKDVNNPPVTSTDKSCIHCGESVLVDIRMIKIAEDSDGVICMPCVQEITNKSQAQIIGDNIDETMKILRENITNAPLVLRKWNFNTHDYEPHPVPQGKKIVLFSTNMSLDVNCANCFKDMQYGDGYTSKTIHNESGLGFPVCEDCYEEERKDGTTQ